MKISPLLLLVISVLFVACSDSSTQPTSSTPLDPITFTHKDQFVLNGNGFDNTLFDGDSVGKGGSATLLSTYSDRVICEKRYTDSPTDIDGPNVISFTLILKGISSGTTTWGDLWTDSTAMGCRIKVPAAGDGHLVEYRSTGGLTTIQRFSDSHFDSLFGVFGGTLKDSAGNTITLTHGKFYLVF